MRPFIATVFLSATLCGAGLSQSISVRQGNLGFSWPEPNEFEQANKLDRKLIAELVQSLQDDQYSQSGIGEFRFAELEPGGLHLVATTDFSGRGFYYFLSLVSPVEDGRFAYVSIRSHGPHVLGREIVDLDGDGLSELLVKELAGGYEGTETVPLYWISVQKIIDGELRDRSSDFVDFYRNEYSPMLTVVERALRQDGRPEAESKLMALVQSVRFKMQREAFGRRMAGLETALAWSRASEADLQILAVRTLKDIEDPRAERALERLAESQNQRVAHQAQGALQSRRDNR